MTIPFDVAIIGYGPVGVTAANLLGALGHRVIVIEREPSIYSRARAISTDEEVLRIWQATGLAERLKQDMLGGLPLHFVDTKGRTYLALEPASRGSNHPPQMFIYQPALEEVLRTGVTRYPNVEVLVHHESVRVEQDSNGVNLTVVDLTSRQSRTFRARYVIAADGGSSPTRAQLGVGFEGRTYEDRWIVIDAAVKQEWPEINRLRFHCDPKRPAVDCPTPLGHHRWEFPILPGDDEAELVTETAVRRLLTRHGIGPHHVDILRATVYSHHVRFADRWRVGRIFLAGDAAHVMPPWIGEGMASGVRDARNLCWKLSDVIGGRLPDTVLDTYEVERQPHVRTLTRLAVNFGRLITERNPILTALRNPLVRAVMRTPILGRHIRNADWFPGPAYTRGFHANSGGADGHGISQPWVLDENGERLRFDDAVPPGWLILRLAGSTVDVRAWENHAVPVVDVLPAGAASAKGTVVDIDGGLTDWLAERHTSAVVLRPDTFTYTSARDGGRLAKPPFLAISRSTP
jgi:3-(3-hydroxy-phenyl)propionate hydroxylase